MCFIIGISGIRTYCTNHKLRNIQYRSVTNLPNGRPHQRTFTNKWDIECDLTHDQSLIEQYNSNNKVNFTLLPSESYTAPDKISLPKGVNETTASYQLKDNLLPGNYILPITIGSIEATQNGTPNNSLVIDKESSTLFRIVKEGKKIDKSKWEIIACNSAAAANPVKT